MYLYTFHARLAIQDIETVHRLGPRRDAIPFPSRIKSQCADCACAMRLQSTVQIVRYLSTIPCLESGLGIEVEHAGYVMARGLRGSACGTIHYPQHVAEALCLKIKLRKMLDFADTRQAM